MTTTLLEICDNNPLRCAAIRSAVEQIISEEKRPTIAEVTAICARLPNFGDPLQVEIDAAMDEYMATADAKAAALDAPAESADPVSVVEGQPIQEAEPVTLSQDEYVMRKRQLEIELADARRNVVLQGQLVREARSLMADRLQAWVSGMPKVDRTTAAKQAIAQHKIDKQTRVETGTQKHVPNSYFDRVGSYGRGDATTFLMKQHRRGGKRFGRGDAMTKDGRIVRLPSE